MALFEVSVPASEIGDRTVYVDLANQLLMISTVMIVMYMIARSSKNNDLMQENFLVVYLYVLIGIGYYHLLIRRLLEFI